MTTGKKKIPMVGYFTDDQEVPVKGQLATIIRFAVSDQRVSTNNTLKVGAPSSPTVKSAVRPVSCRSRR